MPDTPKPSLKDRIKTHLPLVATTTGVGVVVGFLITRRFPPIEMVKMPGDATLHPYLLAQIKEHGPQIVHFGKDRIQLSVAQ